MKIQNTIPNIQQQNIKTNNKTNNKFNNIQEIQKNENKNTKVNTIKEAINNGTYELNMDKTIKSIIQELI